MMHNAGSCATDKIPQLPLPPLPHMYHKEITKKQQKRTKRLMIRFLTVFAILALGVSSFVHPGQTRLARRWATVTQPKIALRELPATSTSPSAADDILVGHAWSPQDLTEDTPGFREIPDDDYIKLYQKNPELWPVEFFLIAYRRSRTDADGKTETQVLVRKSANGTSKYGVGTGVPSTRWMPASGQPPRGYEWSEPKICIEASKFPEFDNNQQQIEDWTYNKIDIREDAFRESRENEDNTENSFTDSDLEQYANKIRDHLSTDLAASTEENEVGTKPSSWEAKRVQILKNVLDNPNSVAAIQGTLRMSGLFEKRTTKQGNGEEDVLRYVNIDETNGPNPANLARSMKIYTMFPQMPKPMPLPSTPPKDLKEEILSRPSRMEEIGRDPHKDEYGRTFTHISTSNISNTIHGVYLSLDLTDYLPAASDDSDDEVVPPALDLFGTKAIQREWVSLQELKVLDEGGQSISTEDPKPRFISGFIVRQLVKDGIIGINGRAK